MQKRPSLQRLATLKPELDFGDRIALDGVKWTSRNGKEFHFYHVIDYGTNYHVAMAAPNRADIQEKFTTGWLSWAGPPNEIVLLDSASEFVSEAFSQFLQNLNIKCNVVPKGAHWQMGRIERHGGVLQEMLSKYELEQDVSTYQQFQLALTQCTMAKNSCSARYGYTPDMLVFGKGLRVPGSIVGDDNLPAHAIATEESGRGIRFRELLSMRESARKAFHMADNSMSLRRAALRRDRPGRVAYQPGEWVMVWRSSTNQSSWVGPARVIQQDGNTTVFCNILKAAPEHIRPVSAVEAMLIPSTLLNTPETQPTTIPTTTATTPEQIPEQEQQPSQSSEPPNNPSSQSSEQPDQEPTGDSTPRADIEGHQPETHPPTITAQPSHTEIPQEAPSTLPPIEPYQIPVPNEADDEPVCDLLTCIDEDTSIQTSLQPSQVWRAEFQIPMDQVNLCEDQTYEETLTLLASASKKQRSEVKLCTLDPVERTEFEEAKTKEIKNWLSTGTVAKIFRHELNPEQILGCRWLYVWKPVEDPIDQHALGGMTRKAKARLVVLGYQDPDLDTIPRDSPTLNRTSKMLIAQILASMGWLLSSFDIKAAFLQGKTQDGRKIAVEPVPEMRREMGLQPNEVCQLVKSAYGRIDAPYLWFQALDRELKFLGFKSSPFDPCLYVLHHPKTKELSGILGVHVDDGLCGGNSYFQEKINQLEKKFPFGSRKSQSFVFTGIEMSQENNHTIVMSQEKYISKINPIHIHPDRKSNLELPVTETERQDLRGLIGSLQYANTRPDLASRLSYLQSAINKATIDTLIQGNKVLHEAKRYKDTKIRIQPIPLDQIRFLAFSDASFASQKSPDSHTGTIIMTTHADIAKNHVCPVNPMSWGCRKNQRVVTSTLSAETTSLSTSLDQLSWLKLYWGWIQNPELDWKNATQTLQHLPPTYATVTLKQDPSIAVTDCKSLYDLVTRTAPPNCSEFRVQLQARAIKDLLAEGTQLRWVHSGAQLADTLTKIMESHVLRHTLKSGMYSLHDDSEILKERASTRTRVRWLDNNQVKKNTEN